MLTRSLLSSTIFLIFLLKNINCDRIECPRAEFITTGVDLNQIVGEWHSKLVLTLEGEPQNTTDSSACVGIKIGEPVDGKMLLGFHAQKQNTSDPESRVIIYRTYLTITQNEDGFKAELFSNFTGDESDPGDEPDLYIYIMSVEAEKHMILMQCEMVGDSIYVDSATILTRRLGDSSKPAVNDKQLVSLTDVVVEKTRAQVKKRLNYNMDCLSNARNYQW